MLTDAGQGDEHGEQQLGGRLGPEGRCLGAPGAQLVQNLREESIADPAKRAGDGAGVAQPGDLAGNVLVGAPSQQQDEQRTLRAGQGGVGVGGGQADGQAVVGKIIASWVATLPIAAGLSMFFYFFFKGLLTG